MYLSVPGRVESPEFLDLDLRIAIITTDNLTNHRTNHSTRFDSTVTVSEVSLREVSPFFFSFSSSFSLFYYHVVKRRGDRTGDGASVAVQFLPVNQRRI